MKFKKTHQNKGNGSTFAIGDLVTLICPDYRDIKRGTMGIVLEPINEYRHLMCVWVDGQVWSFAPHEFVHTRNYREQTCR